MKAKWALFVACTLIVVYALLLSQASFAGGYGRVFVVICALDLAAGSGLLYLARSEAYWRRKIVLPALVALYTLLDVAMRFFAATRPSDFF